MADPIAPAAPAPSPSTVVMVDGAGKAFDVPTEQVAQGQAAGWRPVTDPGEIAALDAKTYGSQHPGLAALAGAADTASFGVVPAILQQGKYVDPGTLKGLAEGSPTATMGGKALGVLAPALASGGESLAAEGAEGLNAGRATSTAGKALEVLAAPAKAVGKLGQATADAVGGGTVGAVAKGAVEGGIYGAGDALSESAIDDKPLTADLLLSHVGPAALFGAGASGTLEKALGFAAKSLPGALEKASSTMEKVASHLEELGPGAATGRVEAAVAAAKPSIEKGLAEAEAVRRESVEAALTSRAAQPEADQVVARLQKVAEALPEDTAERATLERVTERLKGRLSDARDAADQVQSLEKAEATLAARGLEGARAEVRGVLHSEQLWGKAGPIQSDFASRMDALRAAADEAAPLLKKGGIKSALKAAAAGDTGPMDALKGYVDHTQGLLDHAQDLAKDLPTGRRNLTSIQTALDQVRASSTSAVDAATPSLAEHAAELLPHGLSTVAKAIVAPSRQAEVIAHIIGQAGKVTGQIARLSREALSGAAGKASTAAQGAAGVLGTHHFGTEAAKGESRAAAVARHAADHASINNLPAPQLASKLADATATLGRHAPSTAVLLQQAGVRAQQVLSSALPKNPTEPMGLPGEPKWQPSDVAAAKYERVARAVQQPLSLLEDLKSGTVSTAAVAAVKAAYPALYEHLTEQLTQAISERGERIPYQQRLQLSVVLGRPLDPSLKMLPQLQANVAPKQPEAPQPAGPATSGPLTRQSQISEASRASLSRSP